MLSAGFRDPRMVTRGAADGKLSMRSAKKYLVAAGYVLLIVFGSALLLASLHFHIYSMRGWQMYGAMGRECHPVWEDFNFRRICAGDDVDDVIARTNPITLERK